jgi:hypothetical protein
MHLVTAMQTIAVFCFLYATNDDNAIFWHLLMQTGQEKIACVFLAYFSPNTAESFW